MFTKHSCRLTYKLQTETRLGVQQCQAQGLVFCPWLGSIQNRIRICKTYHFGVPHVVDFAGQWGLPETSLSIALIYLREITIFGSDRSPRSHNVCLSHIFKMSSNGSSSLPERSWVWIGNLSHTKKRSKCDSGHFRHTFLGVTSFFPLFARISWIHTKGKGH